MRLILFFIILLKRKERWASWFFGWSPYRFFESLNGELRVFLIQFRLMSTVNFINHFIACGLMPIVNNELHFLQRSQAIKYKQVDHRNFNEAVVDILDVIWINLMSNPVWAQDCLLNSYILSKLIFTLIMRWTVSDYMDVQRSCYLESPFGLSGGFLINNE